MSVLRLKTFLILLVLAISAISIISAIVIDGITVNEMQDCTTEFYDAIEGIFGNVTRQRDIFGNCVFYNNYTLCLNTSGANTDCSSQQSTYNFSCVTGTETYQNYEKIGENIVAKSRQICIDAAFKINDKLINYSKFGWNCERTDYIIFCDAPHQSNKNGKCESGERCAQFDIRDLSKRVDIDFSPTSQIGEIKIE